MSDTKWYMDVDANTPGYMIWGVDNVVYGPVDLPTLIAWVKDERVTPNTWVFLQADNQWQTAQKISELQMFFPSRQCSGRKTALPRPRPCPYRKACHLAPRQDPRRPH